MFEGFTQNKQMRRIICSLIFLLLIVCSLSRIEIKDKASAVSEQETLIPHFFTHSLIAYPEIAFDKGNAMRVAYDRDCITVPEFKNFLDVMYQNNYALVDILEIYKIENGKAVKKQVTLASGKKPMILSFDDINYYSNKMNLGMSDKLIVSNGKIATFTKNAKQQINYDNEVITVLENFIKAHPDFSYNNARGIINLTGFDGVLGYRTQTGSANRVSEIVQAKTVVSKLKELGWKFACHSYGHYAMKKISCEKFSNDTQKWINEVEPIVGKTDIYVYPYGNWEISVDGIISEKHQCLIDNGFKFFMGVSVKYFFGYLPRNNKAYNCLFMDRVPLEGNSFRINAQLYSKYFDVKEVYDEKSRYSTMS